MQDDQLLEDPFAQHQNPIATTRQYEFVIGHYIQHIVELHLKMKTNFFLQINVHDLLQLSIRTMTFSTFQNILANGSMKRFNFAIQHYETTTIKKLVSIGIKETYLTDEKPG